MNERLFQHSKVIWPNDFIFAKDYQFTITSNHSIYKPLLNPYQIYIQPLYHLKKCKGTISNSIAHVFWHMSNL